jgi:anti-sigma regulatory factor (Ser/Thr protein kinase)
LDRRTFITLTATRNQAVFIIRDEGPGFDLATIPDPDDPTNLESIGGRGLLLIGAFMDDVHHNESGNELTMIKRKASCPDME